MSRNSALGSLLEPILGSRTNVPVELEEETLQELPIETLFLALKESDAETKLWVYEHARPEQVQGLWDLDLWAGDQFRPESFAQHMALVCQLDPERVALLIGKLDSEPLIRGLQEWIKVEPFDPQNPPEISEDRLLISPDSMFALEILTSDPRIREMLRIFMDRMSMGNIDVLRKMLEACRWELKSDLEEFGYKIKKGRLEDLGFVDREEALAMYSRGSAVAFKKELLSQPPLAKFAALNASANKSSVPVADQDESENPDLLPQVLIDASENGELFEAISKRSLSEQRLISFEMARSINGALSADGLLHHSMDQIEDGARRGRAYMAMGFIFLRGADRTLGPQILENRRLQDLLRLGFLLVQDLRKQAEFISQGFNIYLLGALETRLLQDLSRKVHPELDVNVAQDLKLKNTTLTSIENITAVAARLIQIESIKAGILGPWKPEFATQDPKSKTSLYEVLSPRICRQLVSKNTHAGPLTLKEWRDLKSLPDFSAQFRAALELFIKEVSSPGAVLLKERFLELQEDVVQLLHADSVPNPKFFAWLVSNSAS